MIKTNHTIPLLLNDPTHTTNNSSSQSKFFHTWYKHNKKQHKPPPIEHTSPIRNTPEKLSSVRNIRTIRAITHLLDPYKRNSSDTLITTLTHIIHWYDRTHKLLQ